MGSSYRPVAFHTRAKKPSSEAERPKRNSLVGYSIIYKSSDTSVLSLFLSPRGFEREHNSKKKAEGLELLQTCHSRLFFLAS
jgi:hypothetical protein